MERPRVIRIENGEKVEGTFSVEEMAARLDRLRASMADNGIDAALFTSYHCINYYSDFLYCAFGRNFGLVVSDRASTSISANID
ncbi:MAG: aminopeptidase P family N-terminal domain-containing protein, partial [Kiloniellaceae bacterium]